MLRRIARVFCLDLTVLLIPGVAYAEVSDKIPSVAGFWLTSAILVLVILALSWARWWAGLVLLPISALVIAGSFSVVWDPYVGPAAVREQGRWYPIAAYGSSTLLLIGHGVGVWFGRLRLRYRGQTAV